MGYRKIEDGSIGWEDWLDYSAHDSLSSTVVYGLHSLLFRVSNLNPRPVVAERWPGFYGSRKVKGGNGKMWDAVQVTVGDTGDRMIQNS